MNNNQFIQGDCMDYLPMMADNAFDLAIIDTQWGIGEDGRKKRSTSVKQPNGKSLDIEVVADIDVEWDNEQPSQVYFDQLFRVAKYHIIFGCNYLEFEQKGTSSGRIVWDKCTGANNFSDAEILWTNLFPSVRILPYMWSGMMQGKSLRHPRIQQGNKRLNEKRIQSCQKPVMLYQGLLRRFAQEGWRILDTHVGSASSLIACEIEGFEYTGFEILSLHFQRANERLEAFKKAEKDTLYGKYASIK